MRLDDSTQYPESMKSVEAIESAVEALSGHEFEEFRSWFFDYDHGRWDQQLEKDSQDGKLDDLAREAAQEYRDGRSRPL